MGSIFGRPVLNPITPEPIIINKSEDNFPQEKEMWYQIDHPSVQKIGGKIINSLVTYIKPTHELINELNEKTICIIYEREKEFLQGYRSEYDYVIDIVYDDTKTNHYKDSTNYQKTIEIFQKHGYKKHELSL